MYLLRSGIAFWFGLAALCAQGRFRGDVDLTPSLPGLRRAVEATGLPPRPDPLTTRPGASYRPSEDECLAWELWWAFHADEFRTEPAVALAAHQRDAIVRALRNAASPTAPTFVTACCLHALARIGADHAEFSLRSVFVPRLRDADASIRNVAAFALTFSTAANAADLELACDLATVERIDDEQRAHAVYGCGLFAHRTTDLASKRRVLETMQAVLSRRGERALDSQVAAVLAIGMLDIGVATPEHGALLAAAVRTLDDCWQRPRTPANERVQAHCPLAIAKLLGPAHAEAAAWRQRFAAELTAPVAEPFTPQWRAQSCALALGQLVRADDAGGPDGVRNFCELLQHRSRDHADPQVRRFAWIALAKIGGADHQRLLAEAFAKNPAERSWVALAMALLPSDETSPSPALVERLQHELTTTKAVRTAGAVATALGLLRATATAPALRERLRQQPNHEELAGALCAALARLHDTPAIADLQAMLARSVRRPRLTGEAALALADLGAVPASDLVAALHKGTNLVALADLARAIARTRDPQIAEALCAMLADPELADLPRGFAAAALGGLADPRTVSWQVAFTELLNYRAVTPTLAEGCFALLRLL